MSSRARALSRALSPLSRVIIGSRKNWKTSERKICEMLFQDSEKNSLNCLAGDMCYSHGAMHIHEKKLRVSMKVSRATIKCYVRLLIQIAAFRRAGRTAIEKSTRTRGGKCMRNLINWVQWNVGLHDGPQWRYNGQLSEWIRMMNQKPIC